MRFLKKLKRLVYANLAIVFPHFRMLPTEDLGVKKTVAFARCGFRACLPSDLCVLVGEGYMLRRPGVIEGIQVKRRIKSIVSGLCIAGLRRRKWSGRGHYEVVRKGVVDDVDGRLVVVAVEHRPSNHNPSFPR